MARRVASLTLDSLDELAPGCRRCVFWELAPHAAAAAAGYGQTDLEKEAWISSVLLEWGSCGRTIAVDGQPAGHLVYAPPGSVPRAAGMPTAPVSADAVLLTSVRVLERFQGSGLGRVLVQAMVKDLGRRGVRAVEAFGDEAADQPASGCVVPADFLRSVGFKTVRAHHRHPRLRLELHSALTWKEDVEAALERLLSTVSIPAGAVHAHRVSAPAPAHALGRPAGASLRRDRGWTARRPAGPRS